jgi:hypothetical protein
MATPDETKARLSVIKAMMTDGKWLGRSSVFQLASDWEISVSRVEQLAAEAKRNG